MQARVLPVSDRHHDYARSVRDRLRGAGLRVEVDVRSESIGRRIRDGELAKIPYLLIVGDKETEAGTVSARARHRGDQGPVPLDELAARLTADAREPEAG